MNSSLLDAATPHQVAHDSWKLLPDEIGTALILPGSQAEKSRPDQNDRPGTPGSQTSVAGLII